MCIHIENSSIARLSCSFFCTETQYYWDYLVTVFSTDMVPVHHVNTFHLYTALLPITTAFDLAHCIHPAMDRALILIKLHCDVLIVLVVVS